VKEISRESRRRDQKSDEISSLGRKKKGRVLELELRRLPS